MALPNLLQNAHSRQAKRLVGIDYHLAKADKV
jgi:hypothetical protein